MPPNRALHPPAAGGIMSGRGWALTVRRRNVSTMTTNAVISESSTRF